VVRLYAEFALKNSLVINKSRPISREVGIKFTDLRKLHYNVVRYTMDPNEADVLAGRAKTVSAQHYALYQLDKMTESSSLLFSDVTSFAISLMALHSL